MAAAKASRRVLARSIAGQLLAKPSEQKQIIQTLAAYLIENKMASEAKLVMNDIAHELFVQGGELSVTVTSARPLNDQTRKELEKVLLCETGTKRVVLSEQIDEALLGGFTVRTPDQELDASIQSKLKQLKAIK
jgi:ATP synthase F1 delta subunit